MRSLILLLVLVCLYAHGLPIENQEVNIETNENDPEITKMYAKEIEQGDNAELPLEGHKSHKKHHRANKKHGGLLGPVYGGGHGHHVPVGLPISGGLHGFGHGAPHIDYDVPHIAHIGHHGHGHHLPGHGPPLPIIYPHEHRVHQHPHHHHHHLGHFGYPEYMPLPYAMPLCVMEKDDDDKKKDDKKKDDKKKKTKRQLVPCHYYGPPGAGWGAYQPGWTGAGWGAPYWY